jgi:aldose 1-epimerase
LTLTVELTAGPARASIAPEVGGSLAAFEWRDRPILRPTKSEAIDERDVQQFACFPLVPFSNRIAGARLDWSGKSYPLIRYLPTVRHAIHGNAWQRAWDLTESAPSSASLELIHDAREARAMEWPFPYRARQNVTLAADSLTMQLDIENTGDTAFPCGLGWHPYFPRSETTELGFHAHAMWETDSEKLPTRLVPLNQNDFTKTRAIAAATLDNCFVGWQPPAMLRWAERRLAAEIGADPACDHLVVYVPGGANFLAVEPATHMTDAFNRADRGEPGTGTRVLAPGAHFSCTMRISIGKTAG